MKKKRILPAWCKEAKIALIKSDQTITDLAKTIGMSRTYTSQVVNGSVIAPELASKITAALKLTEPYPENIF